MKSYVLKSYIYLIESLVFIVLIRLLIIIGYISSFHNYTKRDYSRLYDSKMLICSDGSTHNLIKNFKFVKLKEDSLYVFDKDTNKFYDASHCYKYSDIIKMDIKQLTTPTLTDRAVH